MLYVIVLAAILAIGNAGCGEVKTEYVQGPKGAQGEQGPMGAPGQDGQDGVAGPQGPSGTCDLGIVFVSSFYNSTVITTDCGANKVAIAGGGKCGGSNSMRASCTSDSLGNCVNGNARYYTVRCSGSHIDNQAMATCINAN